MRDLLRWCRATHEQVLRKWRKGGVVMRDEMRMETCYDDLRNDEMRERMTPILL
jgi:hypothetical protein